MRYCEGQSGSPCGAAYPRAREIPHVFSAGRYSIDFDALEAAVTPRTRFLLYTSPSNPLGWVATEEDQDRLLEFTRRHSLWLVADEVYERLYYLAGTSASPKTTMWQPCAAACSTYDLTLRSVLSRSSHTGAICASHARNNAESRSWSMLQYAFSSASISTSSASS